MGLYDYVWLIQHNKNYELRSNSRNTFMSYNTRLECTRDLFFNQIIESLNLAILCNMNTTSNCQDTPPHLDPIKRELTGTTS